MASEAIRRFLMAPVYIAVLLVVAIVLLVGGGTYVLNQRLARRARSRIASGITDQSFLAAFPTDPESQSVASVTLRSVQELAGTVQSRPFPVLPGDSLYRIYGVVDEDLDDLISIVLARCGRKHPSTQVLAVSSPIHTVEDLVAYVAASPSITDTDIESKRAT